MTTNLRSGVDVVDAVTGVRLGRVHAIYLDPDRQEVAGFSLRRGKVFWRVRPGLIDLASVRRFGPNAVAVTGRAAFGARGRDPAGAGLIALDKLVRRPVRLEDGTVLGRVAAVRFCADTRRLGCAPVPMGWTLARPSRSPQRATRNGTGSVLAFVFDAALTGFEPATSRLTTGRAPAALQGLAGRRLATECGVGGARAHNPPTARLVGTCRRPRFARGTADLVPREGLEPSAY